MTTVETLIVGYAAIALLSTLWSVAPALTLVRATQLLIVSAFAIVAVRVLTPQGAVWTACTAVALYVLVFASLAVIFPWASGTDQYLEPDRFAWFSVHPVEAGTLAAIGALGLIAQTRWGPASHEKNSQPPTSQLPSRRNARPGSWELWSWELSAAPLVILLVLTRARGPLLAFVAGLGMVMLMRVRSAVRIPLILITAAVSLVYLASGPDVRGWVASAANQDSAISRLFFRDQTADEVLALNGRLELWDDLRPAIARHSLVGYGYQASRPVVLDAASWASYAHNALLQTVLDLGLVGVLALITLVIAGLFGAMRPGLASWLPATVPALMVFLVLNSFSTESFAGVPGFETLLLFVCVLCSAAGQRRPAIKTPNSQHPNSQASVAQGRSWELGVAELGVRAQGDRAGGARTMWPTP
jgi:O-antigen ligase